MATVTPTSETIVSMPQVLAKLSTIELTNKIIVRAIRLDSNDQEIEHVDSDTIDLTALPSCEVGEKNVFQACCGFYKEAV